VTYVVREALFAPADDCLQFGHARLERAREADAQELDCAWLEKLGWQIRTQRLLMVLMQVMC